MSFSIPSGTAAHACPAPQCCLSLLGGVCRALGWAPGHSRFRVLGRAAWQEGWVHAQLVIPGSPPDGRLLSVIYLCPSCVSLQSPARPSLSVQQMPGLTGLRGTGGNHSVSPGAVRVAAFALEVACGAELVTQHTPLEWGRVVARPGGICLEQGCAHANHHLCA